MTQPLDLTRGASTTATATSWGTTSCTRSPPGRAAPVPQGVVARPGGDRFVILLHDVPDIADVFEASAAFWRRSRHPLRLAVA